MKVRVSYITEFGPSSKIIKINDLLRTIKRFEIINIVEETKIIYNLKDLALLRDIALEHDSIPDLNETSLEEILEYVDESIYDIRKEVIEKLIGEYSGWSVSNIEEETFRLINEYE